MNATCERWVEVCDRAALGEPLTEAERAFQEEHGESCALCSPERRVWQGLAGALEQPRLLMEPLQDAGALPRADELEDARPEASREVARRSAPPGKRRLVLGMAVGLAAAAAASTVLFAGGQPDQSSQGQRTFARIAFVSGNAELNGERAAAGAPLALGDVLHIRAGSACLVLEPAVTVCAEEDTELALTAIELEGRRVALRAGRVLAQLEPQPAGARFGIETPHGVVLAKGTLFAVELADAESTLVRVHEGTVVTELRDGTSQTLRGPSAAKLRSDFMHAPLAAESAARDAQLIHLSRLWTDEASCTLDVAAAPGGRVALDGNELGDAPLTALVKTGEHRLTVQRVGFSPVAERLTLRDGERVVRSYELAPLPDPPQTGAVAGTEAASREGPTRLSAPASSGERSVREGPARSSEARGAPMRAAELLARARALRAAGGFAEASSVYRQLIGTHPHSDEARAALVSLGELQLTRLGDAAGALASFEAYLNGGGALTQEALFGKIRALRSLRRTREERATIERFLAEYPQSVQAANLRARLVDP